jgi:hypothetical protein
MLGLTPVVSAPNLKTLLQAKVVHHIVDLMSRRKVKERGKEREREGTRGNEREREGRRGGAGCFSNV